MIVLRGGSAIVAVIPGHREAMSPESIRPVEVIVSGANTLTFSHAQGLWFPGSMLRIARE